ncbi:MAG: LysR substrate-binding domain-containing protein, partial [Reyranella sp.]|nr:LysR substrate-binding domain-containing protein [Reyranella sp.]
HHPAVNIRFVGGVSNHLRQMLSAGDLDVALFFNPKPTRELALTPLFSERLLLVGDRACGYRLDRPLPFSHLAKVPLALAEPGDPFRQYLEGMARGNGLTLNVRFEVAALQALKALAAKGLAQVVASLHAVRADLETGMLTAAPVDNPAIIRTLVLALPEERAHSPAMQHLAAAVRDEVAMLVADGSFLTCEA